MSYTELQITSNFSFLRGASHPEELAAQAAALNHSALAITDRNTLAGIVRAHAAAKKHRIRLIPGARVDLLDGPSLLALPTDKAAYGRLSALLTLGNRRAEKGDCHLYKADVYAHTQGLQLIVIPPIRSAIASTSGQNSTAPSPNTKRRWATSAGSPQPATTAVTTPNNSSAYPNWRNNTESPSSPPTTSTTISPPAGSCRTSSPASAKRPPSTTPATASTRMRNAI
ncbi:PHP domain-containing protein [Puia sp. P3]|uniref:PHP domain-containing protein n=1 Tax=Puia sp. P3 TaxID=3423952 RepID=UPI003D66BE4D